MVTTVLEAFPSVKYYKKIPVEVQAVQWNGSNFSEVQLFCAPYGRVRYRSDPSEIEIWIEHSSSWGVCPLGHYIVRDVAGAFYPCEPGVFESTHQEVQK